MFRGYKIFGKNKILKPENHDGSTLDVQEIFPTFQGEGPFVGYPSVFIRLGGCNLACDFCDIEFDSFAKMSLAEILARVEKLSCNSTGNSTHNLVVITGGEPLRQPIERLCQELITRGFLVQIETNGTLFRDLSREVKIICSPKNTGAGYHKIRADLLARIDAFKFIISAGKPEYSSLAEVGQSANKIPVYLQPMDEYDVEKNHQNVTRVLELAAKHGARVSLQMHKILGVA